MARCDEGYLCDVCGDEVGEIIHSDLYLAYVLGECSAEMLLNRRERHIRCNPERGQYIVDPGFPPLSCPGFFDKASRDAGYVSREEARVTRAWRRLQAIPGLGLTFEQYPLPADGDMS